MKNHFLLTKVRSNDICNVKTRQRNTVWPTSVSTLRLYQSFFVEDDADVLPEEDQSDVEMSDQESETTRNWSNLSKKRKNSSINSDSDDPSNEDSGDDELEMDM